MTTTLDWQIFAQDAPALARQGWRLMNRPGKGAPPRLALGSGDGRARRRPCRPLLDDGRLYVLVPNEAFEGTIMGRPQHCELRAGTSTDPDGEFRLTAEARPDPDPSRRARLTSGADAVLLELRLEDAGLTRRAPTDAEPSRIHWRCLRRHG